MRVIYDRAELECLSLSAGDMVWMRGDYEEERRWHRITEARYNPYLCATVIRTRDGMAYFSYAVISRAEAVAVKEPR